VIIGVEVVEKRQDFDRCVFTYEDASQDPEGQSANPHPKVFVARGRVAENFNVTVLHEK